MSVDKKLSSCQNLKGTNDLDNIKVIIRFKGNEQLNDQESKNWICSSNNEITTPQGKNNQKGLTFTFDQVLYGESQQTMYSHAARGTIEEFTQGFNGTIFAYGQSGSGKTFSMLGPEQVIDVIKSGQQDVSEDIIDMYGIIPRAVFDFFEYMNKQIKNNGSNFKVYMNYFEIYKENLINLLSDKHNNNQDKFKISNNKVLNADPVEVYSPEDIFKQIKKAQQNVHFESTNMNERSSRSHTVLTLSYIQTNKDNSQQSAKLNLVDLAGTERIVKTGVTGITLKEAKEINLSLTQLGIVINKLSEGKKSHIPYRDSKLTHLLKESLGGNSKTTLLCTVSRNSKHLEESIQSLKFAQRVKNIKNKAKSNIENSPEQMVKQIKTLQDDIQVLNQRLNLIRAEPDKIEYYIALEKKQLMIKEDQSSDAPSSEDLAANFSPLSLNTSLKSLDQSCIDSLPDQLDVISKPFDYQERDPQDMLEEMKAEYDVLKKEKEKEIDEYKDKIHQLNEQLKNQEILMQKDVNNQSKISKGDLESINEWTKHNETFITNFQKLINTNKRSNTLLPDLTQLQVQASPSQLYVNEQPSECSSPSIYPPLVKNDQVEEWQPKSGQNNVGLKFTKCAFNQRTSFSNPIFNQNEFCVQDQPNDDQEMDELLKFLQEIQDNVQSVLTNTHDLNPELKDCESQISQSIDQKQNYDLNVEMLKYSVKRSIDIARLIHQLYQNHRKRTQNWHEQVQSTLDELQSKQLQLKANQQDKKSIKNLEERISCLLQEIKEREDQLNECTDQIVRLEQSNQQLKELVVEIEKDEEQQCKLKLTQLMEEAFQKQSDNQKNVNEQNQFNELKIQQLELYIEKLESMQKDNEDRLVQKEQKLAEDQLKLQSDQILIQQQCQQNQDLQNQLDNMVDKVIELTAENKMINEQRFSQKLQINNLKYFVGRNSHDNIQNMPFEYQNELGELDLLEQVDQKKESNQTSKSVDCSLKKVEAELQKTYFEFNQDHLQIKNSSITEQPIDVQQSTRQVSLNIPAIETDNKAIQRMYTMRHELFNQLSHNQIDEESQEGQIDSNGSQVYEQLSFHKLDCCKSDSPVFKIASDYKNSFDQENDPEIQIQKMDQDNESISDFKNDNKDDHQFGSYTTCNSFGQNKNDFQFQKHMNMKQNRENSLMMLCNKLGQNNTIQSNNPIYRSQSMVAQNRNLTTQQLDLGHLELCVIKERRPTALNPQLNFPDPLETNSRRSSQKQFSIKQEEIPEEEIVGRLYQFVCEKYQDIVFENTLDRNCVSKQTNSGKEDYQLFIMCVMKELFERQTVSDKYFNQDIMRETRVLYQEAKNMNLKYNQFQEFINKNLARFRLNELDRQCTRPDKLFKHNESIEKQQFHISELPQNNLEDQSSDRKVIGNSANRQKNPIDNLQILQEGDSELLQTSSVLEYEQSRSEKLQVEQTQLTKLWIGNQRKTSQQQLSKIQMSSSNNKYNLGNSHNKSSKNIQDKMANDNVNSVQIFQKDHRMTETPTYSINSINCQHQEHQSSSTVFDSLFNLLKPRHSQQIQNKNNKVVKVLSVQSNENQAKIKNKSNKQSKVKPIVDTEQNLKQLLMMD